ncbi:MAG: HIT family protein [Pseudonocardia sp.]|uniref:HIT family protein n=1 Tax=unclassified Pseudonocardia TaxID=2619320 RepID=UPI00086ACDA0|nr:MULTISPECIES: HIT family protein [unclassified Pseudonocardia]MBN9107859.1 HIT family protein [Pseudonocardia sp.]ODU23021.1 MAG: diadenosine tetraphosphate hydrolase [Pseudonocardia sp. SCN 72-51]ODV07576.1 MAG: diadenosine tetraphosphate hydrolase [Pseudonocardia sp. SCN 73-27]
MSTLFTKIIDGELPARFVWSDDTCVGFLSINPLGPGHTLVVPRAEVDHWVDAQSGLIAHLTAVSHVIGNAVRAVSAPPRVGLLVAGFEVPHLHVHVFPAWDMAAFDFANAAKTVDDAEQDGHAEALRAALRDAGHADHVPAA